MWTDCLCIGNPVPELNHGIAIYGHCARRITLPIIKSTTGKSPQGQVTSTPPVLTCLVYGDAGYQTLGQTGHMKQ